VLVSLRRAAGRIRYTLTLTSPSLGKGPRKRLPELLPMNSAVSVPAAITLM